MNKRPSMQEQVDPNMIMTKESLKLLALKRLSNEKSKRLKVVKMKAERMLIIERL